MDEELAPGLTSEECLSAKQMTEYKWICVALKEEPTHSAFFYYENVLLQRHVVKIVLALNNNSASEQYSFLDRVLKQTLKVTHLAAEP